MAGHARHGHALFLSPMDTENKAFANMEVLGATASAVQLTEYGKSAFCQLIRLYKAVHNGPAAYRDQSFNIFILLNIVQRMREQENLHEDPIPQLLVEISILAHKINAALEKKGLFGLHWALITGWNALSETFASLNGKRDLLHLHISERNQNVLSQIRSDIVRLSRSPLLGEGRTCGSVTAIEVVLEEHLHEDRMSEPNSSRAMNSKDQENKSKNKEMKDGKSTTALTANATSVGATFDENEVSMCGSAENDAGNGYEQPPKFTKNKVDLKDKSKQRAGNAKGWNDETSAKDSRCTTS
ncbi:MAG: hypothetical protein M1821_000670 [Bathelium mastoideum]|nr:MAG: hypothetical protein M1821_000670 [Bathelium mastoideum]